MIAPLILAFAIVGGAAWYFSQTRAEAETGVLTASGTIEGTQIEIASEVGGRVLEVLVKEGDSVHAGQVLVRFDDALLQAQLAQAKASLEAAQANYALVSRGSTEEQRQLVMATAELELIDARQALKDLQESSRLTEAQLLQSIAAAEKVLDDARQHLDAVRGEADPDDVDAAWAAVVMARDRLEKAQEDFAPYEKKDEDNLRRATFLAKLAAAQQAYDSMVYRYNSLVGESNRYVVALAEADVALAEAKLADARRQYENLEGGVDPDALALAEARVKVAESRLVAARAGTPAEELAAALAHVDQAEQALEALAVQEEKTVIAAPADGVILVRAAEPGEVLIAGAPLLMLLKMDELTITVYIPEDRYGQIETGERAVVEVDSFPGEKFEATVLRIADKAEFTPRNVQTVEGRRTTVFAVELAVADPEGKLKPGMPADVTFEG
jgi:HlyD family secretion protein